MTNLALVEDATRKQSECAIHGTFTATQLPPLATKGSQMASLTKPYFTGCPACEADREARRQAQESRDKDAEFMRRLRGANIPLRFSDKTLGDYVAASDAQRRILEIAKEYAANFNEHFAAGRCLILSGKVGTGKTHIACGILRKIIVKPFADAEGNAWKSAKSHLVRYTTASGLIRAIRDTWNKSGVSEEDAIRKFTDPDLLVLDEVGRQFGSDAERTHIEELIDLRYQEMKPTIVCTNVEKSQLPQFLGERGLDRLRENAGIMAVCDWASHRGSERGKGDAK